VNDVILNSIAETTTHRDRDGVHCAIVQLLLDFLDAESVAIYSLVDDGGVTRLLNYAEVSRGNKHTPQVRSNDLSTLRELSEIPEWESCVHRQQVVQYSPSVGIVHAVLPIEAEREVAGLLFINCRTRLRARVIDHINAILRILKNHLALLDYGELDTLTGMLNRKTYEASFEKLRQRLRLADAARGMKEPSWLGLVDIDKFKCINDNYGHLFGDEVLLLVSQLMKKSFRGTDQLFRFGGEEFVIVLDHATTEGVEVAFDRLRETIAAFEFPQVGRVTISLGYSQIYPTDSPSTCVERADAALYYAKHHGRNNIRSYEMLVAAGELSAKDGGENVELF
jgi:diguanylate cyclase (GGDEF)-like protein